MQIKVIIYFLLVLLLFFRPNSKAIQSFAITYLFILFAFCGGTADYLNYENGYENTDLRVGASEVGFLQLEIFLNKLALPFQSMYILCAVGYLITLTIVMRKLSGRYFGFVLAVYMTVCFFLNVVQLRFSYATIFFYWGFYALLAMKKDRDAILVYIICTLLATLFHISSVAFFVFLPIRFMNRKQISIATVFILVILISFASLIEDLFSGYYLYESMSDKISQFQEHTGGGLNMKAMFFMLVYIICFLYMFLRLSRMKILVNPNRSYIELGINICLLMIALIPLFRYGAEFRRIYFAFVPILVAFITKYFQNRPVRLFAIPLLIFISVWLFYFQILGGNIRGQLGEYAETVFLDLFKNNLIF